MKRARKDPGGARAIRRFLMFLGIAAIVMKLFIFEGPAAPGPSSGPDNSGFMPRTPTDYVRSVKNSMAICFSPDGKLMASGGLSNQIIITDMDGQSPARAVINAPDMSAVYAMSFSSDRSVLAVAGDFNGSNIRIIDTTTGRET
ncbi:MAG: hypothetical protein OEU95_05015, partial [Nitrospirota bacterium]|nr:hypothetical protein [Nitrospirota bacterium]